MAITRPVPASPRAVRKSPLRAAGPVPVKLNETSSCLCGLW
jgi:hypothetical protein